MRSGRVHSWEDFANNNQSALVAATTRSEIVLALPATDADAFTVLRIVGQIYIGLQANAPANTVLRGAWGIYIADSGSAGDLNLDLTSSLDMGHENWLMWRAFYMNTVTTVLAAESSFTNVHVDIKVSRKVPEGSGLKLVWNCADAYVRVAALRGLVLNV